MDFNAFEGEYRDLTDDVTNAGYETYELKIRDLYDFIDGSPAAPLVAALEARTDFRTWYDAAALTVSSMVGSGRLEWSRDREERLGQQLALFRHFSNSDGGYINFASNFMWAGSRYDEIIAKINSELFQPFARDLLKYIGRTWSAPTASAPASDRTVFLDHNSPQTRELLDNLAAIERAVIGDNQLGDREPEDKGRIVAELGAGQLLLRAARVRAEAVWTVIAPALKWIAAAVGATVAGIVITAVIVSLAALLGVSIPGLG